MKIAFRIWVAVLLLTMFTFVVKIGNAQQQAKATPPIATSVQTDPARIETLGEALERHEQKYKAVRANRTAECMLARADEYRRRSGIHPDAAMPWSEINKLLDSCN
jgi:hypothetical protein